MLYRKWDLICRLHKLHESGAYLQFSHLYLYADPPWQVGLALEIDMYMLGDSPIQKTVPEGFSISFKHVLASAEYSDVDSHNNFIFPPGYPKSMVTNSYETLILPVPSGSSVIVASPCQLVTKR